MAESSLEWKLSETSIELKLKFPRQRRGRLLSVHELCLQAHFFREWKANFHQLSVCLPRLSGSFNSFLHCQPNRFLNFSLGCRLWNNYDVGKVRNIVFFEDEISFLYDLPKAIFDFADLFKLIEFFI